MQYQTMPFGWSMPIYLPLPPTIDDRDLFINSVVNSGAGTPGPEGPAGVGVVSAEVTDNPGDLLLLLTDGTVVNAGNVIGPPGPPGPAGTCKGCVSSTITITEDYCASETNCYIGAQLKDKATVTLPSTVPTGTRYSIKLEFGAPVGNRKLTLQPEPPSLINGVTAITLTTPYESVNVIYNNDHWWTI
jgi:hypothetical protein